MSTIIDLGKLRFQFRNDYSASTTYEYNDVVVFGGNVYAYINVTAEQGNDPTNTSYWALMVNGLKSRGNWSNTTAYAVNDIVLHGGAVWRATAGGTGQEPPNSSYWEKFLGGYKHLGEWSSSTAYKVDDSVVHGGSVYRATANNTNQQPPDTSYWEVVVGGFRWKSDWDSSTAYEVDEVVVQGGGVYRAKTNNTGNAPSPADTTNCEVLIRGFKHRGAWTGGTAYEVDDSVTYLGQVYRSTTNHTAHASNFLTDLSSNWERIAAGSFNRGAYAQNTAYFKGDLVQTGTAPNLNHYISLSDHTSHASADPGTSPESAEWTRLIAGSYTSSAADRHYAFFVGQA